MINLSGKVKSASDCDDFPKVDQFVLGGQIHKKHSFPKDYEHNI